MGEVQRERRRKEPTPRQAHKTRKENPKQTEAKKKDSRNRRPNRTGRAVDGDWDAVRATVGRLKSGRRRVKAPAAAAASLLGRTASCSTSNLRRRWWFANSFWATTPARRRHAPPPPSPFDYPPIRAKSASTIGLRRSDETRCEMVHWSWELSSKKNWEAI